MAVPEQPHSLVEQSADFEMWIVVFRAELLNRLVRDIPNAPFLDLNPEGHFCRIVAAKVANTVASLCRDIHQARDDIALRNAGLGLLAVRAWRAFSEHGTGVGMGEVHPAVIRAIEELGRGDDDSLAAVAARSGMSASHLSRLFKRELGESFVSFRARHRLERVTILKQTSPERDLLSLALEAGFGSYTQFHRDCVHYLGEGPRVAFR